ncbi:MAG: undecaprenyl-diphosphate phosphatase [Verrucomicrobia bacterium]|nr:undecaprenyl-diphosphate phosphatase [Verrucomicrobiota bacterium]
MPVWFAVICLGVIEGITEFLPVSSTGHLLIAEHWLPHQSDLFNVVIQSGTVLAVIGVFWERLRGLALNWRSADAQDYLAKLAVAFVLTGMGGLALEKGRFKLPEDPVPIAWATLIGGVLFLLVERWLKGKALTDRVSWTVAVLIGVTQLLAAVFPGTSRSGITILGALALGLSRPAAVEFSFLLGVPTLLAAGGLKIFKALHQGGSGEDWSMLLLATVVATATAFVSVKWLVRFVQTHTFIVFGWYRVVMGLGILGAAALHWL